MAKMSEERHNLFEQASISNGFGFAVRWEMAREEFGLTLGSLPWETGTTTRRTELR